MSSYISRTFTGFNFECFSFDPSTGVSTPFKMFVAGKDLEKATKQAEKALINTGAVKRKPDKVTPVYTFVDNEPRRMKLEEFYNLSEPASGTDAEQDAEDAETGVTEPVQEPGAATAAQEPAEASSGEGWSGNYEPATRVPHDPGAAAESVSESGAVDVEF